MTTDYTMELRQPTAANKGTLRIKLTDFFSLKGHFKLKRNSEQAIIDRHPAYEKCNLI
jgi:hypothetical protein